MVAFQVGFCQEPRFRLANLHLQSQSSRYEAGSQLRGRRSIFVGPSAPEKIVITVCYLRAHVRQSRLGWLTRYNQVLAQLFNITFLFMTQLEAASTSRQYRTWTHVSAGKT